MKTADLEEFPSSALVRNGCTHCQGQGSVPGQETKTPQAMQAWQENTHTHANWENTERSLELQPGDQSTNLHGQAQAISR